jgi:hypothetical protein
MTTERAIDIADAPPMLGNLLPISMIVSRFGNQSVECPAWLLEQLQHERQSSYQQDDHSIDEGSDTVGDSAKLIAEAEVIRRQLHE